MIKGYFPVSMYAKMNGINIDTAWHRVWRNSVPSIIGVDGERYVYTKYETELEKDYITLTEFCRENGIKVTTMRSRIAKGVIPKEYYRIVKKKKVQWIYIRKTYQPPEHFTSKLNIQMQMAKPKGYLTVKEWSTKTKTNYNTTRIYVNEGLIPSIRVEKHRYIPEDFVYKRDSQQKQAP